MKLQKTVSTQVSDEVRKRAKVKAAQEDKSLAQVIRELIERWLKSDAPANTFPTPADKK